MSAPHVFMQRKPDESHAEIGIIVAAYNAENTLARCIESILAQEYSDWRAVIVDDGSVDDTYSIANSFASQDSRIKVIRQENAGEGGARNAALPHLETPWIVYLDSDDAFAPDYLAEQSAFVTFNPGYDVYACNGTMRYPDGSRALFSGHKDPVEITLPMMLSRCRIMGGGSLMRRETLVAFDGFRVECYTPDYHLWLRMLADGRRIILNPVPLYEYYVGSASNKTSAAESSIRAAVTTIEDIIDSGRLSDVDTACAREAIEDRYLLIEKNAEHVRLLGQRERILEIARRLLGKSGATVVARVGHRLSRILLPVRKRVMKRTLSS